MTLGENGQTPLHEAAALGDHEMARVLLEGGVGARTRDGRTAVELARGAGHEALADYLGSLPSRGLTGVGRA